MGGMRGRKERKKEREEARREERRGRKGEGRGGRRTCHENPSNRSPPPGLFLFCFPSWWLISGTCPSVLLVMLWGLRERPAPCSAGLPQGATASPWFQHRPLPPAWCAEGPSSPGPPPVPPSSPCQGKEVNRNSPPKEQENQEPRPQGRRSPGFYADMGLPVRSLPGRLAGAAPGEAGKEVGGNYTGWATAQQEPKVAPRRGVQGETQLHSPTGRGHSRSEMPKQEMRCNL